MTFQAMAVGRLCNDYRGGNFRIKFELSRGITDILGNVCNYNENEIY